MSLLLMDGYDFYQNASEIPGMAGAGLDTSGGRYGVGAVTVANAGMHHTFGSETETWFGVAWNPTTRNSNDSIVCGLSSILGDEISLNFLATSDLWTVYRGISIASGVSLGTFTKAISQNTWHWIDFRGKLHGSTGEIEIWIDGTLMISLTGQNTKFNGSATAFVSVFMAATGSNTFYFDDLVVYNLSGTAPNSRLGDCKIITAVPTSDTTKNDGTQSIGGTHFGVVDEAYWSSSDYIDLANTSGLGEYFGFTPGLVATQRVIAVGLRAIAEETSAGSSSIKLGIRSGAGGMGGSPAFGSTISLGTSYVVSPAYFPTDPATSAAWAYSAVNAMLAGLEVP